MRCLAVPFALLAVFGYAEIVLADSPPRSAGQATLQEVLEVGLKLRRPVEFQFVEKVVGMVDRGELPRSLVESTFLWARRQHGRRPFPYFERGLRKRAQQIGVEI